MAVDRQAEVTECLRRLDEGDRSVVNRLLPFIYDDLRALAEGMFRQQPGDHTLQPTALVHDAYLRLVRTPTAGWTGRKHFFDVAAMAMRQLLTDYARRRRAEKRGGNRERVVLEEAEALAGSSSLDLVDLDELLDQLKKMDPRQARVVELRFLTGLTIDETAELLGVSSRTIKVDWQMARSWLRVQLKKRGLR